MQPINNRILALVDCNSFYVSCERLFRPDLKRKPVVVLSNNDGCIISRSTEAKQVGIKMGEPYFKAKPLLDKHKVSVFSSNYELYGDLSRRVMKILKEFSPDIEFYSIDEAFLDLTNIKMDSVEEYILNIRKVILKWTGIPVSIGAANTKTLAKVANHVAKKNKLGVEEFISKKQDYVDEVLKTFPVQEVWGIGRQLSKFFNNNNFYNAYELKYADNYWVRKNSSVVVLKTIHELNGTCCFPLNFQYVARKNCCVSRSFGKTITEINDLKEAVVNHCITAAERIRSEGLIAKSVYVFIKTSRFKNNYVSRVQKVDIPIATNNTLELVNLCSEALESIYIKGYFYSKAGVIFSDLKPKDHYEKTLFSDLTQNLDYLMKVIDQTNSKFGRGSVTVAAARLNNNSKMRRDHSSKIDTSYIKFAPTVRAY
jgi:DNA polymerase V